MENEKVTQQDKYWAAASYIWVLSILVLAAKKNSKFAQFHAKQGLIFFVVEIFMWFPVIGWILGVIAIVLAIVGIIKSLNGEWWEAPLINKWAQKINL
ncbi:hypothetical protein C4569_02265 [Candidatus Parcubacteria bacterium]|nr:MAG: hypothetical protein C4569_02265 [Candidatus Parcubacteria bacterium]